MKKGRLDFTKMSYEQLHDHKTVYTTEYMNRLNEGFAWCSTRALADNMADKNHTQMSFALGEAIKAIHELEGLHGVIDLIEKIRREQTEKYILLLERRDDERWGER